MNVGEAPQAQQTSDDPKKVVPPAANPEHAGVVNPVAEATSGAGPVKVELPKEMVFIRVTSTPETLRIELANRSIMPVAWLVIGLILVIIAVRVGFFYMRNKRWPQLWSRLSLMKGELSFAGVGKFEFSPNTEDLQIAHRIWTELKTRKAALPFDPEHDVITEVYDSWYVLFGKTRDLIANIPAKLIQKEHSTREIVRISLAVLNDGLRPHLTRWQARYRNWYATQKDELVMQSPQEVQKGFPGYEELTKDLIRVNEGLIKYAEQLARLTHM